jgi:NADPH:quinone reductase-like Zn-dependent oxidoreductase
VPLLAKEPNKSDQDFIKELLECGELTPVIDRCYTLSEVLDALRNFQKGYARGKVVITM